MLGVTHLIQTGGLLLIALIIFGESGMFIGFFFPGDTLLAVTSEVSRAVLLVDFRTGKVVGTVPTVRRHWMHPARCGYS